MKYVVGEGEGVGQRLERIYRNMPLLVINSKLAVERMTLEKEGVGSFDGGCSRSGNKVLGNLLQDQDRQ
jgi:hypothetical protein